MISKEEIEVSIENKYNRYYNDETYKLTIEEAEYILLEDAGFCESVNYAAAKTLLNTIEQLKTREQKLIKKLEEESKQLDEETKAIAIKLNEARDFVITDEYEQVENDEYILILEEKYEKANIKRIRTNEILKILKGENNDRYIQ